MILWTSRNLPHQKDHANKFLTPSKLMIFSSVFKVVLQNKTTD